MSYPSGNYHDAMLQCRALRFYYGGNTKDEVSEGAIRMKPIIRPNRWLGLFVLIMLTACSTAAPAMPSPSPETPEPAATRATPQVDRPTAPASTPLSPTVTPTTDAAAGQATTAPAPAPSPVATASPPSAAVDCSMIELIDPDSATAQAIARSHRYSTHVSRTTIAAGGRRNPIDHAGWRLGGVRGEI
jgi:hypothetical protein